MINRFYRFCSRRTGIGTASNSKSTRDGKVPRASLRHLLNIIRRHLRIVRYKPGLRMTMCLGTNLTAQSLPCLRCLPLNTGIQWRAWPWERQLLSCFHKDRAWPMARPPFVGRQELRSRQREGRGSPLGFSKHVHALLLPGCSQTVTQGIPWWTAGREPSSTMVSKGRFNNWTVTSESWLGPNRTISMEPASIFE